MTITARNYAAQAERGLREYCEALRAGKPYPYWDYDVRNLEKIIGILGRAVHFVLPDGGTIFDDKLRGLEGIRARLPYPEITVEYYTVDDDERRVNGLIYAPKRSAVAQETDLKTLKTFVEKYRTLRNVFDTMMSRMEEMESDHFIAVTAIAEVTGKWVPMPAACLIPSAWERRPHDRMIEPLVETGPNEKFFTGAIMPICVGMYMTVVEKLGAEMALRMAANDVTAEASAVLELCEALSCSNVETKTYQPADARKNKRRVKDGKLPIYETKMLVLSVPQESNRGRDGGIFDPDRKSPRQHLRRGHIRRMAGNCRIWVNSCVVGKAENGKINKQYSITSQIKEARHAV